MDKAAALALAGPSTGDIQSSDVAAPLQSSAARDVLIGAANARATLRTNVVAVMQDGVMVRQP